MSTQANKAIKAEKAAEQDLVDADALKNKRMPGVRQQARAMRRAAKRRRAKARRRQAKRACEFS